MRAWQVLRNGEPADALALGDVSEPELRENQVLVRVSACALNFPDVLLARGTYQVQPALPFTPGIELCGTVVSVADGVVTAEPGDRVLGMPALPHGALADLAVADARHLHPAPGELDDAEAAAFYVAYQTGWFGLHRRANLQAGETLLVHAGAGGVGSAAVQLGKAAGARVVAVVGGAEKAAVATALGADVVVDRQSEDVVAAVKEATGGRGADVVYDPVGGDAFAQATKVVAFEGRIVVVGFASGQMAKAATNHALVKNYSVLGLHWGLYQTIAPQLVREAHRRLARMVADGLIRPLVSERLSMEDAADGLTRLAAGVTTGRLVVEVGRG